MDLEERQDISDRRFGLVLGWISFGAKGNCLFAKSKAQGIVVTAVNPHLIPTVPAVKLKSFLFSLLNF